MNMIQALPLMAVREYDTAVNGWCVVPCPSVPPAKLRVSYGPLRALTALQGLSNLSAQTSTFLHIMGPDSEEQQAPKLTADYTAPNTSKNFEQTLPSSDITTTEGKTKYLAALRESVGKLQGEVNTFLTAKMEEDKALAAMAGAKVDDKKEEENYGEEGEEAEE